MDTYINPLHYRSPLGEAFQGLAKSLLAGKSEADRIYEAERALKAKQERDSRSGISAAFRQSGPAADPAELMALSAYGGMTPAEVADAVRFGAANTYGATDPRTVNAFHGAGGAYGSTSAGYREGLANQAAMNDARIAESARQFGATPFNMMDANGQPVIGTRETAVGAQPVLSESDVKGTLLNNVWQNLDQLDPMQRQVLGANPSSLTPRNYLAPDGSRYVTYDGVTDAQTGDPLPPRGSILGVVGTPDEAGLTTSNRTDINKQLIGLEQMDAQIEQTRALVENSPEFNFGLTGSIKDIAQGATILATNLAQGLGLSQPAEALAAIQQEAARDGVDPGVLSGVFDPKLGQVGVAYGLLVYQLARIQNGPGVLSTTDWQVAARTLGAPMDVFANKQTLLTKLDAIQQFTNGQRQVLQGHVGGSQPADARAASDMSNDELLQLIQGQ